jgi:hypothetical protein
LKGIFARRTQRRCGRESREIAKEVWMYAGESLMGGIIHAEKHSCWGSIHAGKAFMPGKHSCWGIIHVGEAFMLGNYSCWGIIHVQESFILRNNFSCWVITVFMLGNHSCWVIIYAVESFIMEKYSCRRVIKLRNPS